MKQPAAHANASHNIAWAARVVAVMVVILKVWYMSRSAFGHGPLGPRVIAGPDSEGYLALAHKPIFSWDFLAGPMVYPLLIKAVFSNWRAIVVAQTLISIVAWLWLAKALRDALLSPFAKAVAVVGVMATSVAATFQVADVSIGTESISISIFCFVVASGIRTISSPTPLRLAAFVTGLIVAGFTRDTNALFAAIIGIGFLFGIFRKKAQWVQLVTCSLCCVLGAGLALTLSNHGRRWFWPVTETIAIRIVGHPTAQPYFEARGMPVTPVILELHRDWSTTTRTLSLNDPQYKRFLEWIETNGKSTYSQFLISHPKYVLREPLRNLNGLTMPNQGGLGRLYGFGIEPSGFTRVVGSVGFAEVPWIVYTQMLFVLGVLAHAAIRIRQRGRPLEKVAIALAIFWIPHALAIYHGDALGVERHSMTLAAHARIIFWITAAIVADRIVNNNEEPRGQEHK